MPVAKSDPYAVLGVDRAATAAEIRAAYLALVERYHPDRHQGNPLESLASEKMAEINHAYELLSEPGRRMAFDRGGGDRGGVSATASAAGAGGNDGGASASANRGAAPRAGMNPIVKWVLLIFALPLVVRSGAGILRAFAGLCRALFGALGGFRGTPAGFVVALVAMTVLVFALVRRHRGRR